MSRYVLLSRYLSGSVKQLPFQLMQLKEAAHGIDCHLQQIAKDLRPGDRQHRRNEVVVRERDDDLFHSIEVVRDRAASHVAFNC